MRLIILAGLCSAALLTGAAYAQSGAPIKIADVAELSGGGATVGNNWKNGIDLAVEEINAKGGILGRKIEVSHADSQSNPGVARAQVQKALDGEPYVLLGPGYSGSVKVTAPLAAEAGITQIMGGEAAELTQAGNKFLFRTSFGQQSSMPKVAKYINDELKAKSVAVVWVNNDFGRGGRDVITKEFNRLGIKVAADLSTEAGQADFAADVSKIKAAAPDAVFIYVNEEESARILKEIKRQGVTAPLIGETTLVGQKVIELAGDAANGARGHVGLTTDAPVEAVKAFRDRFVKKYNYVPDHNGLKGYLAIYMVKATTEKMGKVDSKAFADTLHGLTIKTSAEPNILMDVTFDQNGDIDRQGFLVEVVEGKQVVKQVLPKLN
ncbi:MULTISPECIES: ABC transporter substrate-binding protein [Bradyrhizobium]|uniref:ABC transporter substrate-binding protein n=2 Tax=Bradyrhizobium TaxID=374 RepID=A0ABS5GGK9_9BRAD|nr:MULTISPECIES: ABC transporter substrate-binding protein [Bradyrhizobium]MBR1139741.1 ABC transporter substrate-binding protein [Bradyrhizobium denitrificans]MDU1491402.1 ABC transporter substrate-binding protein [Bradyrhizobium sp.]MDU1541580.1 ABC transporter substrate-binding protein [Bradyrhizobium sp.]MDU1804135.1 ABC transporter substrate-binding protein [Bradyrhizobium sp.]MDU3043027.1 ABC transporter substrate-binding protein [Bradyrhizobium sp.]